MEKVSTSLRLRELMASLNLRQADIVRKAAVIAEKNKYTVKLSKSDLSQYVSGKVEPGQDKLMLLSETLGVNPAWLMGYDAPMKPGISDMLYHTAKDNNLTEVLRYFSTIDDVEPYAPDNKSVYYLDPDAAELAQEIYDDENKRMLFSATRDISKEDMQFVIDMVERLKRNGNE